VELQPESAEAQRDLGISYSRLGIVARSAGDIPKAKEWVGQALRISEHLATLQPGNVQAQQDLKSDRALMASIRFRILVAGQRVMVTEGLSAN
jgi:hypothetical protein